MVKKIINKIKNCFLRIKLSLQIKKKFNNKKEKRTILIGSPLHGNIGDHAISIAEIKLLKDVGIKNIIELPGDHYRLFEKKISKYINNEDLIIITGGGFVGTLWKKEENMIRSIICNFKNNKIIIMPQTVFFEDTIEGKRELSISKEIYEEHKSLYFFTRDEKSYNFLKENFSKVQNIYLVPEIVTYLNYENPRFNREGVLLCLREDKERILKENDITKLKEILKRKKISTNNTTTVIKGNITIEDRQKIFEEKLNEFKKSRLVITDRLHAMIFSAITATPCIALNNLNGKVKGVYKWIKSLNYIKYIDDKNKLEQIIEELLELESTEYNIKIKDKFMDLIKILKDEI